METENLISKKERDAQKSQSRQLKSVLSWVLAVVVILGTLGLVVFSVQNKKPVEGGEVNTFEISTEDHILGNKDSKVVLIEYSDLQCPSCKAFDPVIEQITEEYADRILFVYRHFPLTQIHFSSVLASAATEAADKQGKFWEMKKIIFANQDIWAKAGPTEAEKMFIQYASDLNLDINKFNLDLKSSAIQDRIDRDLSSGREAQVSGTPTFFLNGRQVYPRSLEAFREELNKVLLEVNVDNLDIN